MASLYAGLATLGPSLGEGLGRVGPRPSALPSGAVAPTFEETVPRERRHPEDLTGAAGATDALMLS
eukprot:8488784-Alexandrium_andersonii.AAC.1